MDSYSDTSNGRKHDVVYHILLRELKLYIRHNLSHKTYHDYHGMSCIMKCEVEYLLMYD